MNRRKSEIAEYLNIDYWTTIAVFKNNTEIARGNGSYKKSEIYELIKKRNLNCIIYL